MPGKAFFLFRQGGRLSPAGGGVGGGVALLRGWEFEGRHNRQLRKKRSHVGRALPAIYFEKERSGFYGCIAVIRRWQIAQW